jgi:hypothetical protein
MEKRSEIRLRQKSEKKGKKKRKLKRKEGGQKKIRRRNIRE